MPYCGAPSITTATSALVPPISSVTAFSTPQARATKAPPITPDAVPDSTMFTQEVFPSSADMTPPFDLVMSGSAGTPLLRRASSNLSR